MSYIKRHAEQTIKRLEKSFSIVLVTGPRQVGKTTLLQQTAKEKQTDYVTFDDPINAISAKEDAKAFLNFNKPPIILDEIQYVPELFPYLKMQADSTGQKGMYYLTGSQQFHLMKNVSESLAGRIGVVNLLGLSFRERMKEDFTEPFMPTQEFIAKRNDAKIKCSEQDVWQAIFQGAFPEVVSGVVSAGDFYSSYIKTYIERDVRALTQVADELQFVRFITVVAGRTAQLLNYRDLSGEIGISEPTAKKWLSILVTSGLVYLLEPYHNNVEKRVCKTPKLYFLDTGLAAHLTRWTSADVLRNGAMAGAFFETFVVSEILKGYYNAGIQPPIYFYRDKDMKEVDLLFYQDGEIYPVEIKKKTTPDKNDVKAFATLEKAIKLPIGTGAVICMTDRIGIVQKDVYAFSVTKL